MAPQAPRALGPNFVSEVGKRNIERNFLSEVRGCFQKMGNNMDICRICCQGNVCEINSFPGNSKNEEIVTKDALLVFNSFVQFTP